MASGILGGFALIWIGMEVLRSTARYSLSQSNSAENAAAFGVRLIEFGVALIGVCFVFGAVVAFGIGPNFLAKRVEGAVVRSAF